MFKKLYNYPLVYLIIATIIVAYLLPWISWGILSISGFELPFTYKKVTNISNKILFFSKKECIYTAFYIYSVPILAILSGILLFVGKKILSKILLFICIVNGLIISFYMYFYVATSSFLRLKNGGLGLYLLLIGTVLGIYYFISIWKTHYRKQETQDLIIKNGRE